MEKLFGARWQMFSIYSMVEDIARDIRCKHRSNARQLAYMHIDKMGGWNCNGSNHLGVGDVCEPIPVDLWELKSAQGDIVGLLNEVKEPRLKALRTSKWRTEGLYLNSGLTCCALVVPTHNRDQKRSPCQVLARPGYRTCEHHAQYEQAARALYGDDETEVCEAPTEVEQSR